MRAFYTRLHSYPDLWPLEGWKHVTPHLPLGSRDSALSEGITEEERWSAIVPIDW